MIFEDNLRVLKGHFSALSDYMERYQPEQLCEVVQTRTGAYTIAYPHDSRPVFIHSKYNPEEEAELFVNQFDNVESYSQVFFYGVGLGHHIEAFQKKYPRMNFSIYEPRVEIMYHFLNTFSLDNISILNLKNIYVETKPEDCDGNLNHYVGRINGEILFIVLPSYERVFNTDYQRFKTSFSKQLQKKKNNLNTNLAYSKRWVANSMLNISYTVQSPSITRDYKQYFKNRPVLLVAAGPSHAEEIETIREIKANQTAFIFSVGSAINALIKNGIYPDAACTYDPQSYNKDVFKRVVDQQIDTIPLVFGTSVGYETLESYPGPLLHMITNQDTVSKYFLKNQDESALEIVQDAPSIAVVTLQLLCKLGCNPIILVGQNFAYRDNEYYAEGIGYTKKRAQLNELEIKDGQLTEDVYGNQVLTSGDLIQMKEEMELYIKKHEQVEFINTTKFGAKIEGTAFAELAELAKERLVERLICPEWYKSERQGYDMNYLGQKIDKMEKDNVELKRSFDDMFRLFKQIGSYARNKNNEKLAGVFVKFDKLFKKIESNVFYKTILLPMNRVHFELLAKNVESIRLERNLVTKANQLIEHFGKFIYECQIDIDRIEGIYRTMMTRLRGTIEAR